MGNPTIKRLGIAIGILAPALALAWFRLQPQTDIRIESPLFHFYIVTFVTFSAAVISFLLTLALRLVAQPRHYLAALAFTVMGTIFFAHGLATPNALIGHFHPAISWSAWLTLLSGGFIFALAGFAGIKGLPVWLSIPRLTKLVVALVIFYLAIALFFPHILSYVDNIVTPWHQKAIFYLSLALWLLATFCFWQVWRQTHSRVDGTLAFVAYWLGCATVSMHQFPVWYISWWLYHFLMLVGFLITAYILLAEYERAREFSLLRYYLAAGLIITALMTLLASYFFTQFSYRALVSEKEITTKNLIAIVTDEVARSFPTAISSGEALNKYAQTLPGYSIGNIIVYNDKGEVITVAPADNSFDYGDETTSSSIPLDFRSGYEEALQGEITVHVRTATTNQETNSYNPFGPNPTIIAFAPLYPGLNATGPPVGVVAILQNAETLNQVILQSRAAGLLITVVSMSVLFGILLLVVARADSIITTSSRELAVAYKNLQQAEAMRDDLTNMVVHDLRNPLTTIRGNLSFIQHLNSKEHAESWERLIGQALQASERMTGLINDMLTVSKIEAGQLELNVADTSIKNLLTERLDGFSTQFSKEDKQLIIDCPPALNAACDPYLIGRVIENLVSNALKYTDDGSGKIEVAAWANNGQVYIRIRDNGEGIPDSYKQHIFGKFSQVPNSNEEPKRRGTGLGLAFCNLAVDLHGGNIWVEDAPNRGSDFIFCLPQIVQV